MKAGVIAWAACLALGAAAPALAAAGPAHPPKVRRAAPSLPAEAVAAAAAVSRLRAEQGLPPVAADAQLTAAARAQASAMAAAGTMSHSVGGDFGSRMKAAGIRAPAAAENVAMGQASLEEAMRSWTQSSGHRDNMLMRQVTRIGLARQRGSDGALYWAMVLASPEPKPVTAQEGGFRWGAPVLMTPFGGIVTIR